MLAKRIDKIFNIHPEEQRIAGLVFAYAILLSASTVLAVTASLGLFFEAYDAEMLPYTYVLLMFVGPLVSFIYLRLNNRLSLSKTLLTIHVLLLLSLILLPLILSLSDASLVLFILPVYVEVNFILTGASYWNLLGRIYNLREGKRLFPILGSGEHLATIGAGFLATVFIKGIGTVNLFWLAAVFMVAAIGLLVVISRANEDKMGGEPGGKVEVSGESGLKTLAREPYVRLLFAVVSLYTIGVIMVDYLAFAEAEIRFPTAEEMATYVALFMGIYGVLGLIVQWLIAPRLLDRFGVSITLLSLPGGLFILMAFFALVGSFTEIAVALFWLSSGANMYAYLLDAPFSAARNVMLQPLPAQLRTQAQTTAVGVAYPLASGLSGLVLLFLLNVLGFSSVQLSYVILVVLSLWLAAGVWLDRAYLRRLRQALLARSFGRPAFFRSAGRSSIAALEEALSSQQPSVVLFALDILADLSHKALARQLSSLLTYPDDKVRLAALRYLGGLPGSQTPPNDKTSSMVKTLLKEEHSPELRAASLRTLWAVDPVSTSACLPEFVDDPQGPVRRAALALMGRSRIPELSGQAMGTLEALVQSHKPTEQTFAAEVISEIGTKMDMGNLLLTLLAEDDPNVKRAALIAASHTHVPSSWPAFIPYLAQRNTSSLAAGALVAGGQDVLPVLLAASLKPDQDPRVVAGIAQVCGRIGGPKAIEILVDLLDRSEATVRRQVFLGLSHCAYQAPEQQQLEMKDRLRYQVELLAEIVAALVDILAAGDDHSICLTVGALEQRRRVETDNLLLMLSYLFEPQTIFNIREALQSERPDEDKQAYAIETLDILLDHEDKRLFFPFLQQLEPEQRLSSMSKQIMPTLLGREHRLARLLQVEAQESGRWPRICAIHALGLLGKGAAVPAIDDTMSFFAEDSVLLETALNSLEQLGRSPEEINTDNPMLRAAIARWQAREPGAMTLLQKAEWLTEVSIFATLSSEALEAVAGSTQVIAFNKEETIVHKDDSGDRLFILLEGQLRVHEDGRTIDTLGAGGVVGEMALLDGQPRSASVTAMTDSRLLELVGDPFQDFLATHSQVARELLVLLSRRLRQRTAELTPRSPEKRVQPVLAAVSGHKVSRLGVILPAAPVELNRLFILKETGLFRDLDDDLLEQVARLLEEIDLTGGETLFQLGEPGHSLYIVIMGQVRVHIAQRTVAYRGEGEVIGEMALLEAKPRSATVTAVVPTQLLRLDKEPFFELLEIQPNLAQAMIKMLSGRLRARLQELSVHEEEHQLIL